MRRPLASRERDEVSVRILYDGRAGAPRFRSQCLVERYSLRLTLQEERLGIVSVSVAEIASASGNGDSWRCRRRDPFRVDIGVRRVSGSICTVSWRALRKWNESRVVLEHHYDYQQSGDLLSGGDLRFNVREAPTGFHRREYPIGR